MELLLTGYPGFLAGSIKDYFESQGWQVDTLGLLDSPEEEKKEAENTLNVIETGTGFFTVTEVRPLQLLKAPFSMLVTLLGMVIEVRPLQEEKAEFPMLVTLLGIVIEVRPLQ